MKLGPIQRLEPLTVLPPKSTASKRKRETPRIAGVSRRTVSSPWRAARCMIPKPTAPKSRVRFR